MNERIERIKQLETLFSDNQYDGSGKEAFVIEEGTIPVMISAPHAINHFRKNQVKWADRYTGGIARYLHQATGCHLIYSCMFTKSDPNYDLPGANRYQDALVDYLSKHKVYVLIDLHGVTKEREYAAEMGTALRHSSVQGVVREEDPSLHEHKFIAEVIKDLMEKNFKKCDTDRREVWKNRIFDAGGQNTVTKFISESMDTSCIQLEINGIYRDPENENEFLILVSSLMEIINMFGSIDWSQDNILIPKIK